MPKIDAQDDSFLSALYPAVLQSSRANVCVNWTELCEDRKMMGRGVLYKYSSGVEREAKGESFGGRKSLAPIEGQKTTKHKSVNNVRTDRKEE